MIDSLRNIIEQAYTAFNKRNIGGVLMFMHREVQWPNGWEGGYLQGHNEVRDYWSRQWKEIDPTVIPISVIEREDGRVEVIVHQKVKNLKGEILIDGIVRHIYTFENGLIMRMEIE